MARDISGYIRELLFRHDCVIVPGFGAFIGNFFPAHIDRREGLFTPPSRKITFNRHLTGNDGLLIGHISSTIGVGYVEARDMVNEWADDLREKIMEGNPVPMDHLGIFSLNYEGAIVFEPDTTVNYLLSSYGLGAYHRLPVKGFDVRKRVLEKSNKPAVSQPSIKTLLTRAAVIIPVLIALALVPFNDHLFKRNIEESTLNPLAKAELEYNREQIDAGKTINTEQAITGVAEPPAKPAVTEKETETGTAETGKYATVEDKTIVPENTVRPSAAVVVEDYRYLLIIGSFKGEENALYMVKKLQGQGYNAEVAGGPEGFLRVSASSYNTLDEAKEALGKLKKDYPGAWVFKSR